MARLSPSHPHTPASPHTRAVRLPHSQLHTYIPSDTAVWTGRNRGKGQEEIDVSNGVVARTGKKETAAL